LRHRRVTAQGWRPPAAEAIESAAPDEQHHAVVEAERRGSEREAAHEPEAVPKREDDEHEAKPAPPPLPETAAEAWQLTAAKEVDTVAALDAFLTTHPRSRHVADVWALRSNLAARDVMYRKAVAFGDPGALDASYGAIRTASRPTTSAGG
jgi:hypothetical protein